MTTIVDEARKLAALARFQGLPAHTYGPKNKKPRMTGHYRVKIPHDPDDFARLKSASRERERKAAKRYSAHQKGVAGYHPVFQRGLH